MKTLKSAFNHTFSGDATNSQMGIVFMVIAPILFAVIILLGHTSTY